MLLAQELFGRDSLTLRKSTGLDDAIASRHPGVGENCSNPVGAIALNQKLFYQKSGAILSLRQNFLKI
jgi:hypothetical protein